MKFLDRILLNPCVSMTKGEVYPFIEMGNVSSSYRQPIRTEMKPFNSGVRFQDGDTVIARITPCLQNGKRFYCDNIGKGFGSTEFLVFRPKDVFTDNKYLYYFMQTDFIRSRMINSMTGATGRQRVNNKVFENITVDFPDTRTQRKIGKILSSYDDLVENNHKQIKLLEEAAQLLYKEWFVDFRFPGHENTAFVDGLPSGWHRMTIDSILCKIKRPPTVKKKDYLPEGSIPIIDQGKDFIAGYTNDQDTIVNVKPPVIVFGDHTRSIKYIQFPFACGADGTQLITSRLPEMPVPLLYFSIVKLDLSNYHYARHFKFLKAETIIVPTIDISKNFLRITNPILRKIHVLRTMTECSVKSRNQLLTKLITGTKGAK
ncbi:MAG: restriction endonuclease subunit S [Thermoguttaceae bacterium]|nr:restriction endonuclease subunit S [Thermoguttaceae bacterium]